MPGKGRTPRTPRSHRALQDLATRQYGVVSMAQMLRLGYCDDVVLEWARAGRLHRLHQGVYAVGHRSLSWRSWCMAGVLGAEPNETDESVWPAVASHSAAAYLWGIYRFEPGKVHVTAPVRRRACRPFVVHFSSILTPEDRSERDAIPVTSVPRTLLDLAIGLRSDRLDRCLERTEELGLFDLLGFESILARAGGHRGRGRLTRALSIYRPDPAFTRSKFERAFRRAVIAARLPAPSMNHVACGFELDAYWPSHRFAVELDLFETHGSRAAFERDHLRQEELKLQGIEMIRITGPRFRREPGRVMERIGALLRSRRRELNLPEASSA